MEQEAKKKSNMKNTVLKILLVIAILLMAGSIGVGDYSHVKFDVQAFNAQDHGYEVEEAPDEFMAYVPAGAKDGIIFYPGGNIEYTAYMELLDKFAEKGILCVAVHMPRNIPFLGTDQADRYIEQYPQIENWYLMGHDKGGTAAAKYVAKTDRDIQGLCLLASFSRADLTRKDVKVLVMYGTSDAQISMVNYNKGLKKLPEGYVEQIIRGGNHSYYGHYEVNREDSVGKISREKQQETVLEAMLSIMK